jgi:predicted acyltransferase
MRWLIEIIFAIVLVLLGYVAARNLNKHHQTQRTSTFIVTGRVMSGIADRSETSGKDENL